MENKIAVCLKSKVYVLCKQEGQYEDVYINVLYAGTNFDRVLNLINIESTIYGKIFLEVWCDDQRISEYVKYSNTVWKRASGECIPEVEFNFSSEVMKVIHEKCSEPENIQDIYTLLCTRIHELSRCIGLCPSDLKIIGKLVEFINAAIEVGKKMEMDKKMK